MPQAAFIFFDVRAEVRFERLSEKKEAYVAESSFAWSRFAHHGDPVKGRPLYILLLAVFIDLLNFSILIPVLPLLFADSKSKYFLLGPGQQDFGYILLGILTATYSLCGFVAAPILGQLADRYGRKPLLALSLAGVTVGYVVFSPGIIFKSIPLLFLARIIDGLSGGRITVAQSAIADLTPDDKRAQGFGFFGAAFSLGFVVGPLLSGFLSDSSLVSWFSLSTPFWIAAGLSFLDLLLVWFAFPETLKEKSRAKLTLTKAFTNVRDAFKMPGLRVSYITVLLYALGFTFFTSFFNVFLVNRLGYNQRGIGLVFALLGASLFVVDVFLIQRLKERFGSAGVLRVVFFGAGAALLTLAFVTSTWEIVLLLPVFALFEGLVRPNLSGLISTGQAANDQGRLLGISSSLQSFGRTVPPLISGPLAAATSPAVSIMVAGGVLLVAGGVFNVFYTDSA